jgi:hypothetical protein
MKPGGAREANAEGPGAQATVGSTVNPAENKLKRLCACRFPQSAGRGVVEFGGTGVGTVSINQSLQ